MNWFVPRLAGARQGDRLIACIGALAGISATALLCLWLIPSGAEVPLLMAPLGASAVLLFAVPASPLAQPWAVLGGNVVSALVGVAAARWLPGLPLAAGVAVGGAILAMSALRCLHPPGGAVALTAVIGGPAVAAMGFGFALMPVALNSVVLVGLGWAFHRFSGHSYPHRVETTAAGTAMIGAEDIDHALAEMGEAFDVAREDLDHLFAHAEAHARRRLAAKPVPLRKGVSANDPRGAHAA